MHSYNCIVKAVYNCLLNDAANVKNNWASRVKTLLCSRGFSDVFNNPYVVNSKPLMCKFKQYIRNAFIQSWQSYKESNQVLCTLYNHIKTDFSYEIYLDKVTSPALRRLITQMRTSGHILRTETGNYGQQRLERCCQVCGSGHVEFHFFTFLNVRPTLT